VKMKNNMRPIHPGEVLREDYLEPLNMSANALAVALRIPAPRINDVVRERRSVSPDTALRLSRFFGGDAQSWLNLQAAYDLKIAEKDADLAEIVPLSEKVA
jgi:addiction module HigA family antidote